MTVLVVDDTDTARDVVQRILRFHGVNAFGARNGPEALSLLDQVAPDLVLLDVSMPEMDGLTVLERIRDNPRWHGTPVVMMSAISDEELVGRAFRLGACEYLVKAEFSAPRMLEIVRRHAHGNDA
ncbi:MAG TPA: response regulator [Tepidisphaeraceae bacterium]|jgi:CheY-like chemotaxis protein